MDRQTVYPGSIPLDTDILSIQRNTMVALGFLAQAALGSSTVVDGLVCAPTTVPSMSVLVGPGSILALATVDATAYGSLGADSTDPLVKMGVNIANTSLTMTAPVSAGTSINYLIEAAFLEADTNSVVLPYYNAANPAAPYSGPSNSGTPHNTQRTQRVQLQLKAGTPATTGTQTTPAVDSGWTGLYVVTVAYAQTTIVSGNISIAAGAPFIPAKLPQVRGNNMVLITATGTWTVPTGVTKAKVRVWGAGGTSDNATGLTAPSGGGGAGGYTEGVASVTPGSTITVTIGTCVPTAGATGGTSSFGSIMSATGGSGGVGSAAGTGGIGVGGTFIAPRSGGSTALIAGTGSISGGVGGPAFQGGAATFASGQSTTAFPGNPGQFPGGGASGGTGTPIPAGGSGLIIIEW